MKTQYHLVGRGFSGRAIRVQPLSPDDTEMNLVSAAKLAGPEAPALEIKKIEWRLGVKMFVKEISESCTAVTAETKFKPVTAQQLDDLSKYFTNKDYQSIEAIYRDWHEVMKDELDAITGKAISLSED